MQHVVVEKLAGFLDEQSVRSDGFLVGVSGGADSVALLCALRQVQAAFDLRLRVVHVDHGLRRTSADDAQWVGDLCRRLDVPCDIVHLHLQQAEPQIAVSEETARNARSAVFRRVAQATEARWLATAHTADDQAETVLHHILRGTSWRGLRGIPASRRLSLKREHCPTVLIRPWLGVTRAQIIDFLRDINQDFREDESNRSMTYTRNKLRHQLLPQLQAEYGEHVPAALGHLAEQAAEVHEFVQAQARELLRKAVAEQLPHIVRWSRGASAGSAPLLVREACVLLWEAQGWPRQSMTSRHWANLARIILGDEKHREIFPGKIDVERRGQVVTFQHEE